MVRTSVLLGNTPHPTWSRGIRLRSLYLCLGLFARLISSSSTNQPLPSEEILAGSQLRGQEPRFLGFLSPGDRAPPGYTGSTSRTIGWTCSQGPHTAGAVTLSCLVGSFTNYCFGLYTPMHRCVSCFALVDAGALGKPENDLNKAVALAPLTVTAQT